MSSATSQADLPDAPLTAATVRALLGWSQIRVAVAAGVSVGTVRLFEAAPFAVESATKRRALQATYASMRAELLRVP